jgi:hypothetical protein
MKQRGRVSLLTIFVILGLLILVGIVVSSDRADTPERAAREFMNALATNDAPKLAANSYMDTATPDEVLAKWEATCKATKYYRFQWAIKAETTTSDTTGAVTIGMFPQGGQDLDFRIPVVKQKGTWYVDVRSISREFFPFLPR